MSIEFSVASKLEEARALPAKMYTSKSVYQAEKSELFRKQWVAVARVDQLPEAGDFLVVDFFDDELIVVRDKAGNVNAFSNICLHRGCPLLSGSGSVKGLISCPYHKWAYELDGQLRGAPLMDQARGFNAAEMKLPGVKVEEWQGWIFLNGDSNAPALAPKLVDLEPELASYGFSDLKVVATVRYESPWNWKILLENFMESYHHIGPHTETLNPLFPAAGTFGEETSGSYLLLENPPVEEGLPSLAVGTILPMTLFSLLRDPENPSGTWYQMHVKDVDHFELDIHILATDTVAQDPEQIRHQVELIQLIHSEDIPMCDGVWKGVQNPLYVPGRLSHLEKCNWQFYRYLEKHLAAHI